MQPLGENIRNLRVQKGLSQKDLAEKIYKKPSVVGSYERGVSVIQLDSLLILSKLFEIDIHTLATIKIDTSDLERYKTEYRKHNARRSNTPYPKSPELGESISKYTNVRNVNANAEAIQHLESIISHLKRENAILSQYIDDLRAGNARPTKNI